MKYVLTVVMLLIVLGVVAFLYAWSGTYNIAATEPHWSLTSSFIKMLRDRSIEVRNDDIKMPGLNTANLKQAAFYHYHEMCRLCHGAPEYPPEEFAEGLYPGPPNMASGNIQKRRSEPEIYWIAKHGIKMTGMPAFGLTHSEEELWGIVTLAKGMHQITPEQYRQMFQAAGLEGKRGLGHTHGEPKRGEVSDHGHDEPSTHGEGKGEHQ